ncbi:MAG: hypothetical protein M0D57_13865 [Sphingobacteriales bacterium JAD_PAG50586_3]|nr:MAG: hypothetical protein M0D57_13865 [Sphingobacteriales bacterium JAD_PAG50586_3]
MRLAYIITCHKNIEQVCRLIDRLNNNDSTIVIHASKTSEPGFFEGLKQIIAGNAKYANVFFCKREDGTHNSFGIVKGVINGLTFLFKNNIQFDYVSLISGQDYPIKSNTEITEFFIKNNGKQFLDFFPLSPRLYNDYDYDNSWGLNRQHYRIDRYHFVIDGEVLSIPELLSSRLIQYPLFNTVKIFLYESKKYIKQKRFKKELGLLFWSRVLPRKRKIPTDFDVFGEKHGGQYRAR